MFYTFYQNNSGGSFIVNDSVAHVVIIEAPSANVANAIAEDKGLYFDGCDSGADCSCCGDRWGRAWDDDGKDTVTKIYSDEPLELTSELTDIDNEDVFDGIRNKAYYVYYLDGRKLIGR